MNSERSGRLLDAADAVHHWNLLSAIYALTEEEKVKLRATEAYAFAGGSATTGKRKLVALIKADLVLTAKTQARRNEKFVSFPKRRGGPCCGRWTNGPIIAKPTRPPIANIGRRAVTYARITDGGARLIRGAQEFAERARLSVLSVKTGRNGNETAADRRHAAPARIADRERAFGGMADRRFRNLSPKAKKPSRRRPMICCCSTSACPTATDSISSARCAVGGHRTPILVLTARGAIDERIAGLDAGADDYLVKPFNHGEFLARCRALLRRSPETAPPVLTAGVLVFDPAAGALTCAGADLP